jgi:hypothetical protein
MNVPPPAGPGPSAPAQLRSICIRDFREDPSLAPGGGAFVSVLNTFLPIVYGTALKLVPENPASASQIATSVFECLAVKWRRLSKRTLVGPWLLAATRSVALRERKRLRLPTPVRGSSTAEHLLLFKRLSQQKLKFRNALLLRHVLQVPPAETAAALRIGTARSEKHATRAFFWLRRKLRKTQLATNLSAALEGLSTPPPEEVSGAIIDRLGRWTPKVPRSDLTRSTLVGWRWLAIRLFFKRVLAGLGAVVCVLLLLGGTFAYLAHHGYLNDFFMNMGNRELAREFPEALAPARNWPVTEKDFAHAQKEPPKTSADLYRSTNIWLARFTFTEDQWEALQPTRIPPVRNLFQDGRIILRNPNAKRSGLSGSIGYEFNWTEAQVEFAGKTFPRAAVRYRGNGTFLQSRFGPKQSFKVDLNKYEKKQSLAKIDELNLVNAIPDFSYVRDSMSQLVFRELGVPAPRTAYAYLSVDVPNKWTNQALGLYCLIENIDKDFAEDRFGSKKVPIFKPVTYDLFQDLGSEWNDYAVIYDLKTEATPEQLQRVVEFARFVSQASDEEFARRLGEFLDIEEFAGFVGGHALLSSYDGFFTNGQNYYLYLDPASNKFGFISWDQDHSWGEFGYVGSAESREQASIWEPAVYEFQFLQRVMAVPAFREAYKAKLQRALETFFTKERLYPEIDRLAAAIRPAVAAESDFRLTRFDQSVSSEWLPGDRNSGPSEGPRAPVHQIKRFIENRINSVRDQLAGESDGVRLSRGRR